MARQKNSRPGHRVGASSDPAILFDEAGAFSWSRMGWINALSEQDHYTLICNLVERFALPLFLLERPQGWAPAETIRDAIALGRQMAAGKDIPRETLDEVAEMLEDFRRQDQEYIATLPRRPVDAEYQGARMCLYAASYCVSRVPDVAPTYSYIRYAAGYHFPLKGEDSRAFDDYMAKIDEAAREFLRLVFHRAEQHAYEEGYPVLQGREGDVVFATLYRENMIHLLKKLRERGISDLLDAKLSSADEVMKTLDYTSVYLSNRGVKPSMWKKSTIDNKAAMAAFQVLLNNHNTKWLNIVIEELKTIPRAEIYRKGKISGMYVIGARTKMADNAELSPAKLENLAKRDRMAALRHPNATKEQLHRWLNFKHTQGLLDRLAALEQNPALDLFSLELPSPFDPFEIDLWRARYKKAVNDYAVATANLTEDQAMGWAEYEARSVIPVLGRREPEKARQLKELLDNVLSSYPPSLEYLEYGVEQISELRTGSERPLNYVYWSAIYLLDAWRSYHGGRASFRFAIDYAKTAVSYAYHARMDDSSIPDHSWMMYRHHVMQVLAAIEGVREFLASKEEIRGRGKPTPKKKSSVGSIQLWDGAGLRSLALVGGKPKWNDVTQEPAKLSKLAKRNPKAYTNANLPIDELDRAALLYPWYVEKNPVLVLLSLEDPAKYEKLMNQLSEGWRNSAYNVLSTPNWQKYQIECAEHVFHLIDGRLEDDRMPLLGLQLAKNLGNSSYTADDVWIIDGLREDMNQLTADAMAAVARRGKGKDSPYWAAYYAVKSIANLITGEVNDAPNSAIFAAIHAGKAKEERDWQTNRVRYYYAKEHPEYKQPDIVGTLPNLIPQCILVDKKVAPTLDRAKILVEKLRYSSAYISESKGHWRFQQQSPSLFSKNSFVTRPVANGVKVIMAAHRPEIQRQLLSRKPGI